LFDLSLVRFSFVFFFQRPRTWCIDIGVFVSLMHRLQITRIMSDLTEEVDRINSSRSGSSSASSSTAAALLPAAGGDASTATQQHTLTRREKREHQRQAAAAAAEQALEDKKRLAAHVTELR
jgi:hypothetical protein